VRASSGFFAGNHMKTPSPHPVLGHPLPPGEGLKTASQGPKPTKDWRATVGMFKDDPVFKEIVELGRQWREEENRKSLEELE